MPLDLWTRNQISYNKVENKRYKEGEKNLCPSGWTTASTATAREAVPGAKRFVLLSLKVIPLVQKKSFRTIVKYSNTEQDSQWISKVNVALISNAVKCTNIN